VDKGGVVEVPPFHVLVINEPFGPRWRWAFGHPTAFAAGRPGPSGLQCAIYPAIFQETLPGRKLHASRFTIGPAIAMFGLWGMWDRTRLIVLRLRGAASYRRAVRSRQATMFWGTMQVRLRPGLLERSSGALPTRSASYQPHRGSVAAGLN